MALVKQVLENEIYQGLLDIYLNRSSKGINGDEQEDPTSVCRKLAGDVSKVLADAVDSYIKSGDIYVSGANITVVSPMGPCTVTPNTPAKVK